MEFFQGDSPLEWVLKERCKHARSLWLLQWLMLPHEHTHGTPELIYDPCLSLSPPPLTQTCARATQVSVSLSFLRSENTVQVFFWGPITFNTGHLQV